VDQTPKKSKKPVSAKQRAEDDKLRTILQDADLKKFDEALIKAVHPSKKKRSNLRQG
jgi:hypothetical protein